MQQSNGNILNATSGIIIQQVNCQGVMKSGVAKDIREKYPAVWEDYRDICDLHFKENPESDGSHLLGHIAIVNVSPYLSVCSIFGQRTYGKDGQKYTSYDALDAGFERLAAADNHQNFSQFHLPLIGAGLGGGKWSVIKAIITEHLNTSKTTYWSFIK